MKVRYPDVVYGAIASSGVAHATLRDWRYFDLIRQSAPAACMAQVERAVAEVDALLAEPAARAKAQALTASWAIANGHGGDWSTYQSALAKAHATSGKSGAAPSQRLGLSALNALAASNRSAWESFSQPRPSTS